MPKADARWMAPFREKYRAWWPGAERLIREHNYRDAFKTYPFPTFETSPWTPLTTPLSRAKVALVTTAAMYRPGIDLPFADEHLEGDVSFRVIPRDVDRAALDVIHSHIPEQIPRADMNTVFPLWRLDELQRDGVVGEVAPVHSSLLGYNTRAADVAEHTTEGPEGRAGCCLRHRGSDATPRRRRCGDSP